MKSRRETSCESGKMSMPPKKRKANAGPTPRCFSTTAEVNHRIPDMNAPGPPPTNARRLSCCASAMIKMCSPSIVCLNIPQLTGLPEELFSLVDPVGPLVQAHLVRNGKSHSVDQSGFRPTLCGPELGRLPLSAFSLLIHSGSKERTSEELALVICTQSLNCPREPQLETGSPAFCHPSERAEGIVADRKS